jgi:hypothetical protein
MLLVGPAILLCSSAFGQHAIPHDAVGNGGGRADGGGVFLNGTVGQPAIGVSSGTGSGHASGYWYVVDRMHIGPTSAVLISAFSAVVVNAGVELNWSIDGALGLLGFNLYRSNGREGLFVRVNSGLIPAEGGNTYRDLEVTPGSTYWYRLGAVDADGESLSRLASVSIPPSETTLYQNYPNPFNPSTTISFYLAGPEHVTLTIYSARGERVRGLLDESRNIGRFDVPWDGRNDAGEAVSSGIYFYRLEAGKTAFTRKLTLLK